MKNSIAAKIRTHITNIEHPRFTQEDLLRNLSPAPADKALLIRSLRTELSRLVKCGFLKIAGKVPQQGVGKKPCIYTKIRALPPEPTPSGRCPYKKRGAPDYRLPTGITPAGHTPKTTPDTKALMKKHLSAEPAAEPTPKTEPLTESEVGRAVLGLIESQEKALRNQQDEIRKLKVQINQMNAIRSQLDTLHEQKVRGLQDTITGLKQRIEQLTVIRRPAGNGGSGARTLDPSKLFVDSPVPGM